MMVLRRKTEGSHYLVGLSDIHIGAKTHRGDLAAKARDWILKNNAWVFDLGDLIELATRYSVGAGVYEQSINPDEQMDRAVEFYQPIVDAGLLLGMVSSNHHIRAFNESGIDVTKRIARELRVPYLGHSGFLLLRVGDQTYTVFGHHGTGGAATPNGKVAAVLKLGKAVDADIIMMGHVHKIDYTATVTRGVNLKTKGSEKKVKHHVITGSYVDYDGGYAEQANYVPEILGTPALLLHGEEKKVDFIRNIVTP